MSDFPSFETDRLQLREIVATDAHDLLAIHSHQRAMQWYGADPLKGIEQAEKLIAVFASWRKLPNPGTRWGIQRKAIANSLARAGSSNGTAHGKVVSLGTSLPRPPRATDS